jgi:hypothetical protein
LLTLKLLYYRKINFKELAAKEKLEIVSGAAPPPFRIFAGGFPRRRRRQNAFGLSSEYCASLRNKQYCILNRQYSNNEYEELVLKIIKHMNDMPYVSQRASGLTFASATAGKKEQIVYKYGEFFPPEFSPFSYNETIAQEYFPLTKEQAIEQGHSWKDPEPRNYQITKTPAQLPDHIKDVPDSITEEIIQCAHAKLTTSQVVISTSQVDNPDRLEPTCNEQCTTAFKIIPDELQFYRKMNLPLPRLCPNCRHYARLRQRNPLKL